MENIIHVIRPQLTREEREKRVQAIKEAAVQLIVATEKQKRK